MRTLRERKGQFIVIAALLLSLMIVSIGTVMYGTVTYFRQERWEEYLTIVDSVKTGSGYVVESSLASYSQALNQTVLRDNLNRWIRDVRKAYPGFGVDLTYTLETGIRSAYGVSLNYSLGLARTWNQPISYLAANATFNINIASAGLAGYSFSTHSFLRMNIRDVIWYSKTGKQYAVISLTVDSEGPTPVISLRQSNFGPVKLSGITKDFQVTRYYSQTYKAFTYDIWIYSITSLPSSAEVTLVDARGIMTVSYTTSTSENTS